jgi:hypothetical protein
MVSSGILTTVRITFDKEKRRCVWYLQVFSLRFESPSIKRNGDVCGILRYSHRYSNTLLQRETRMCMAFSGILIDIRILFDKEKRGCVWYSQVFSSIFEYFSTKSNEDVYDILRYSHWYLNTLRQRETRMCMTFSGILIDIRILFDREKRGCVWHSQVFSYLRNYHTKLSILWKSNYKPYYSLIRLLQLYKKASYINTSAKYLIPNHKMKLQLWLELRSRNEDGSILRCFQVLSYTRT